jgi:hypothetical protein
LKHFGEIAPNDRSRGVIEGEQETISRKAGRNASGFSTAAERKNNENVNFNEESNSFYIRNEKLYSAFFGSAKQKHSAAGLLPRKQIFFFK